MTDWISFALGLWECWSLCWRQSARITWTLFGWPSIHTIPYKVWQKMVIYQNSNEIVISGQFQACIVKSASPLFSCKWSHDQPVTRHHGLYHVHYKQLFNLLKSKQKIQYQFLLAYLFVAPEVLVWQLCHNLLPQFGSHVAFPGCKAPWDR